MGTKITYVGIYAGGVEIDATGQLVGQGETVEVDTEVAEALLEQEGEWARPRAKVAKRAARRQSPPSGGPPEAAVPETGDDSADAGDDAATPEESS